MIHDLGVWDGNTWSWNLTWRRPFFQWELPMVNELLNLIASKSPTNTWNDIITRNGDSSGIYTVKSFMDKANSVYVDRLSSKEVTTFIWQNKSLPRAQMTSWILAIEKLKTSNYLFQLNFISEEHILCPLCGSTIETVQHLFFICSFSWQIWMRWFNWWGVKIVLHHKPTVIIES